jgi:hypothetical protein
MSTHLGCSFDCVFTLLKQKNYFFHGECLDKKMQMEDVDVWWWEKVEKICGLCVFFVVNL